jgi:hypothetical protein
VRATRRKRVRRRRGARLSARNALRVCVCALACVHESASCLLHRAFFACACTPARRRPSLPRRQPATDARRRRLSLSLSLCADPRPLLSTRAATGLARPAPALTSARARRRGGGATRRRGSANPRSRPSSCNTWASRRKRRRF